MDFKDFLHRGGCESITDIWGVIHRVSDVDIILTKSMFKGYGWLSGSGMTWEDYWSVFRKYRHALYITNVSKEKPERFTELNYQFLTTVSVRADEFRPADLPDGWDHSPEEDERHWLTKQTELAYYNFRANREFRRDYFLRELKKYRLFDRGKSREYYMAAALKKNPRFIAEPAYTKRLDDMAERTVRQYAVGRLIVAGDNRYLSEDLLGLLNFMMSQPGDNNPLIDSTRRQSRFYIDAMLDRSPEDAFYAPGADYGHEELCTLLRNPHIARNEESQLTFFDDATDKLRRRYLGHLTDVVMIDAFILAAERLGGADYDGDMVKTIADPIINACVRRNYSLNGLQHFRRVNNMDNIPLLMIPAAEPLIADAEDWRARMETVKSTFSSRVGQICNAALDRSIIAYNENSDDEERRRCREETETLAILVGLEIDSAKSGVRPDLDEYLGPRTVERTPFLQYKNLVERAEERRAWYEPTFAQRLEDFFKSVDWSEVDSNVERLPYLARQLKKHTPKIKDKPAADSELFIFAKQENWKAGLDSKILAQVSTLLKDYEAVLSRIRACRIPIREKPRKRDIDRILYARGQDDCWDAEELYAQLQDLDADRAAQIRRVMAEEQWHFMDENQRERFLMTWLPMHADIHDLLADFRFGGYRVLSDLICDIDDENTARDRKRLIREGDSPAFVSLMESYQNKSGDQTYREAVSAKCQKLLDEIVKPVIAVRYVVALGKRDLLWELLPDAVPPNVLEVRKSKKGFDQAWRNKVRQFQVPLYSPSTKGQWIIRFDVVLADGLEAGSLRMNDVTVPVELEERVRTVLPKGLPLEMVCTLIAYYAANKPEDSDWVVLPVASFDAYFGTTSFGRKYLRLIPGEILERPDSGFGICRYRVREEYQI